ncbi:MAG: DUF5057 domain-containing protein [Clostridiales bacterium]|nr:DUF5057 domain-containing protein [Clostridiales bacterium]
MNKPKRTRRNYIARPKVSKKLIMSTIASVLVLVITATLIWNAVKISVPVEAERLSGVDQALKDHGSGEAFIILDIVAGDNGMDYPGTIGYLTSGQAPIVKELEALFKDAAAADDEFTIDDDKYNLKIYKGSGDKGRGDEIVKLLEKYGITNDDDFNYEESLTGGNGWIKIHDADESIYQSLKEDIEKGEDNKSNYWGTVVYAKFEEDEDGNGEYMLVSEIGKTETSSLQMFAFESASYYAADGLLLEGYQLKNTEPVTINDETIEDGTYTVDNDTYVYKQDENGNYINCGTIGSIVESRNERKAEIQAYIERYEEAKKRFEEEVLAPWEADNEAWINSGGSESSETQSSGSESSETQSGGSENESGSTVEGSGNESGSTVEADGIEGESTDTPVTVSESTDTSVTVSESTVSDQTRASIIHSGWMKFVADEEALAENLDESLTETTPSSNEEPATTSLGEGEADGDSENSVDDGSKDNETLDEESGSTEGGDSEGTGTTDGEGESDNGGSTGTDTGSTGEDAVPGGDDTGTTDGAGEGEGDNGEGTGTTSTVEDGTDTVEDGTSEDGDGTSEDGDGTSEDGDGTSEGGLKDPGPKPEFKFEESAPEGYNIETGEDEEYEEEYIIVEFEHVSAENDEELLEGLYLPGDGEYEYREVADEEDEGIMLLADGIEVKDGDDQTIDDIPDENTFVYVGQGGTHTITMDNTDTADKVLVYGAPTYFRCYSKDLIKEYALCDNGINIQINVKTAGEVTPDDVAYADLIYIEDFGCISGDEDISSRVMYDIIDRTVNDMLPVIVDYSVSKGGSVEDKNYKGRIYQQLGSILQMTDLDSFFFDMGEDIDEKIENMLMNSGSDEYGVVSYESENWASRNVYVTPTGIFKDRANFNTPFGEDGTESLEGYKEVKAAIDMENRQNGTELDPPSRAMAIQYIINYANGFIGDFRNFTVLELQPATGESNLNTRKDSRDHTIFFWRRPGAAGSGQQLLRSRQLIDIEVETESVAQFSGEQSDINDKYQMVFIGLDGQNLNYEDKSTVYNDSGMNGKVYSGVGDIADGEQRYEGIDITPQKKNALLDFMQAGYPVVVENDFFNDKTAKDAGVGDINTEYIDESSQMYEFLKIALSSDDYRWCLYTIYDLHTYNVEFASQINYYRPRIVFDWDNAIAELNYNDDQQGQIVQTISADVEGKYRGYIPYKVTNDIGESYGGGIDTHFYLDMNQDGRFDALEEITGDSIAIGGGLLTVEFATPERGSIPWKLEISDAENRYRRDAITGYFNIVHATKMPIRVIQIIGGDSAELDASFNLEAAYELMSDRAMLGYYLKNAELLTNTKLDISTMTVGQLAEEIKFNPEYLSNADVLVLGFGPACNLNVPVIDYSVEWYVNKYISEGRGVLVSSAAATSDRMLLTKELLGQKDTKTYNSLGRNKPSGVSYYKYGNLEADMFADWGFLTATKINDGAISHYPYEVDSGVSLNKQINMTDYTLDLSSNGASDTVADVTAWYTLGDSGLFDEDTSYGVSAKDAANNYYIYSKGNVFYIGATNYPYEFDGSSGVVPSDSEAGVTDCKLFVNALMEAYSVGIKNPKVTIVAGLSDDAADTESICIPYDEEIKDLETDEGVIDSNGVLDDTVDVYFKVTEPNLAFTKEVTLAFYYEDNVSGTPIDVGGKVVNATQFTSEVWTVEENQLVSVPIASGRDLVPGKVYKIKAPVVSLRTDENKVNADIYIVVQSHFIKLGQDRHPIGSDSVILSRAQLFLLE